VQILVVVAITQMKQLRAEAGHGSEATVIDLGLVGPKLRGNFSQIGLMYLIGAQLEYDYLRDLSILVRRGKDINRDSFSNCE